jgi:hypothetical protein
VRWKAKRSTRIGDKRTKTRFLFFPKRADGEWRWFEKATWFEKYDFRESLMFENVMVESWIPMHWISRAKEG